MTFCLNDIDKKKSGIYCILNTITSLLYIGSTKNLKARKNGHS